MKPDATGTWAYHFDNLDVVDDAGNVIAYTVSEEPVEGMKQLLREPIFQHSYTRSSEVAVKKNLG